MSISVWNDANMFRSVKRSAVMCLVAIIFFILLPRFGVATEVYLDIRSSEVRKITLALPLFGITENDAELVELRNEALKILTFDLRESGLFQLYDVAAWSDELNRFYAKNNSLPFSSWYLAGSQAVVVGDISRKGEELIINAALFDVKLEMAMTGKRYSGKRTVFRQMIHRFADEIVFRFTGEQGIAHTRITFVHEKGPAKELMVIDYDGFSQEQLTSNGSINLSPDWGPNGEFLVYTSFVGRQQAIWKMSMKDFRTAKIAFFEGANSAPSLSPDGRKLALSLSKDGNSEIYTMKLDGSELTRLTFHKGIDTSPSWSPTSREIVFTSDRAGSPQLYIMDAEGVNMRRLTFNGTYNDSAAWSPQGHIIAFASRESGVFNIYTIAVDGSSLRQLTVNQGTNEDPSWSPDGNFITFSSTRGGSSDIYIMDKFGNNQRRLTLQKGKCYSPDWSP